MSTVNIKSEDIVVTTAFIAGLVFSQKDPKTFIEYPITSVVEGCIHGGFYSLAAGAVSDLFFDKKTKYIFAGLIGASAIMHIVKNIKN